MINNKKSKCIHCGQVINNDSLYDGICCYCLYKESKIEDFSNINITPNGTAFIIINRAVKKINIPREQFYWFISHNKTATVYVNLNGNYWHKDCMDNGETVPPEDALIMITLGRCKKDANKPWTQEEYDSLKAEYDKILSKK